MSVTGVPSENRRVYDMFSAVFSQKAEVSAIRTAIIQAINKCTRGKMKFRDILREVQSEVNDTNYTSEKLTYDLSVLKKNGLINKMEDGEYTITENGYNLLTMYQEMKNRNCAQEKMPKTGFKSEVVKGKIKAKGFDFNVIGDELVRLQLFRKKVIAGKDRVCLELRDDDADFDSAIEIRENGDFNVSVILYRSDKDGKNGFLSEFEQSDEWFETACAIAQMITYYIKRTAKRIWKDSKVKAPKPDAYPV